MVFTDVTELANKVWSTDDICQVDDLNFVNEYFRFHENRFKSIDDACAYEAQQDIINSKLKIKELQDELEKHEAIIRESEKIVRKLKRHMNAENANKIGRPERSSEKGNVAKKFVSRWVASLMNELEIKSCAKLGKVVSDTNERNWRRWLNRDAIPTYINFEKLLSAKIDHGKFAGQPLHNISVTPPHDALLTLLRFV